MDDLNEQRLRDDMREVAERLRAHRYEPTPLELDELKRRAMEAPARASSSRGRRPLPATSKLATALLVLGLLFGGGGAGVLATHKGQPDGSPPDSAGHGQHCNSGSGNSFEGSPGGSTPGNPGDQASPDCDPGNSPTHNRDNDREGPGTPGQRPPGPERGGGNSGNKPSATTEETGTTKPTGGGGGGGNKPTTEGTGTTKPTGGGGGGKKPTTEETGTTTPPGRGGGKPPK